MLACMLLCLHTLLLSFAFINTHVWKPWLLTVYVRTSYGHVLRACARAFFFGYACRILHVVSLCAFCLALLHCAAASESYMLSLQVSQALTFTTRRQTAQVFGCATADLSCALRVWACVPLVASVGSYYC